MYVKGGGGNPSTVTDFQGMQQTSFKGGLNESLHRGGMVVSINVEVVVIGATKIFNTFQSKRGSWFITIAVGELHKEKPRVACRKLLNFQSKIIYSMCR